MDILPNPKTAVLMPAVDGHFETAYVNANFVRGHNGEPAQFIAAMGPLPSQLVPFWRMIWKSDIGAVRVFRQKFTIEDAIGSHACSLQRPMAFLSEVHSLTR
jgi:protein tyrosine phosphatase